MMIHGTLSTGTFGTREHVGTPKSYLSIYNTLFYIYPFFITKIYMKMGFLVFHVFQALKMRRFLKQMKESDIVRAL